MIAAAMFPTAIICVRAEAREGEGKDLIQAVLGALCEAVERSSESQHPASNRMVWNSRQSQVQLRKKVVWCVGFAQPQGHVLRPRTAKR